MVFYYTSTCKQGVALLVGGRNPDLVVLRGVSEGAPLYVKWSIFGR
jgi:hypothetical protein